MVQMKELSKCCVIEMLVFSSQMDPPTLLLLKCYFLINPYAHLIVDRLVGWSICQIFLSVTLHAHKEQFFLPPDQ